MGEGTATADVALQQAPPKAKAKAKTKAKAKPKTPLGVDASKPGQALGHILAADTQLAKLEQLASKLMGRAQNEKTPDEAILGDAAAVAAPTELVKEELQQAWRLMFDHIGEVQSADPRRTVNDIKAAMVDHPGMGKAVHKLTYRLARYLSAMEGVVQARSQVRGVFNSGDGMTGKLSHVRGILGLEQKGYDALINSVEIKVAVRMVDLGTGTPRDQIQEAAMQIAMSWNARVTNMSLAVEELIRIIEHAQFKKADPGFMGKLFESAKGLLSKGATLISGTPLAAKLGFGAIEKIIAHAEALEQARVQADQDTFLQSLRDKIRGVQLEGAREGGNQYLNEVVQGLDKEFLKAGKDAGEDTYKKGSRVVFGPQAEFLKQLKTNADSYVATVPAQAEFSGQFFADYVSANHKERNRSPWRSPLASRKYQDGYIEVPITLDYSGGIGFFLHQPGAAKLHCPKSDEVAKAIVRSFPLFHVGKVDTFKTLHISTTDRARDELPESWRDRTRLVQLERYSGDAYELWKFIQTRARTSTYDLLSRFTKLEG